MIKKILVGLGVLALITVVFALTVRDLWWIRIFDYLRVQITLVSIVLLVLSVPILNLQKTWVKIYLVLLSLGVAYQVYVLAPYLSIMPEVVSAPQVALPEQTFRLLVSNVEMNNREVESYLGLVDQYDPDVILAMEVDAWWDQQLQTLQERYSYTVKEPLDNYYGISLYSRLPLQDAEIRYIEYEDVPAVYAVLVLPSGQEVVLYGLHPRPPLPGNSVALADRELLKVAGQLQDAVRPVVVAGDFNDVPWSHTVEQFEEIGGLRDLRAGRGFYNTFDAHNPVIKIPIDHIFTSAELAPAEFERSPAYSSDHFALFAALTVTDQE